MTTFLRYFFLIKAHTNDPIIVYLGIKFIKIVYLVLNFIEIYGLICVCLNLTCKETEPCLTIAIRPPPSNII